MTTLEIARPVLEGQEDLVSMATYAASLIFPMDSENGLLVPDAGQTPVEIEAGIVTQPAKHIGKLRCRVDAEPLLPLIQWVAPADAALTSGFHNAAGRLGKQFAAHAQSRQTENKPPSVPSVYADIERAGLRHDVMPGTSIEVSFTSFCLIDSLRESGQMLALVPDAASNKTVLFAEEHVLFDRALRSMIRLRRSLPVDGRFTPVIPFVWMAGDTTQHERSALIYNLRSFFPLTLLIGTISNPKVT